MISLVSWCKIMEYSLAALEIQMLKFLWISSRVTGFIIVLPIFSARYVSPVIKIALIVMLSIGIFPAISTPVSMDALSLLNFMVIAEQFILGMAMGFIILIVFQAFIIGGQVIAMQSGLGFASLVDPSSGVSVPIISQFYMMLISALFLALDGHLKVFSLLFDSFQYLPLFDSHISSSKLYNIIEWSKWMFIGALLVALPAITALLIINIAFGVMAKSAPQLNIFAVGFPLTMSIGLLIILLTLNSVASQFQEFIGVGQEVIRSVIFEVSHVQ